VIPQKSTRDPERSEGSRVHPSSKPASLGLADFWAITS
jgi:hypothetical protein